MTTPDQAARDFAVDPANDVVLEASAGTGKTRVLVARYVRLIEAGVDPRHILAMTFTRKAAAEMRERVLTLLRRRAQEGALRANRWRDLRNRIGDIQISTIDAFCFGLLREFPLEADVDPKNASSLRILERMGFQREGLLRERWNVGGEIQDSVVLGLLAREWRAPAT